MSPEEIQNELLSRSGFGAPEDVERASNAVSINSFGSGLINSTVSDGTNTDTQGNIIPAGDLIFRAPQFVLDDPTFRSEFDSVLNIPVTFDDLGNASHPLLESEVLGEIRSEIAPNAVNRQTAYTNFVSDNEGSTRDDAVRFFQNISATKSSDAFFTVGDTGDIVETTFGELSTEIRDFSDGEKRTQLRLLRSKAEDPSLSVSERTITQSIINRFEDDLQIGFGVRPIAGGVAKSVVDLPKAVAGLVNLATPGNPLQGSVDGLQTVQDSIDRFIGETNTAGSFAKFVGYGGAEVAQIVGTGGLSLGIKSVNTASKLGTVRYYDEASKFFKAATQGNKYFSSVADLRAITLTSDKVRELNAASNRLATVRGVKAATKTLGFTDAKQLGVDAGDGLTIYEAALNASTIALGGALGLAGDFSRVVRLQTDDALSKGIARIAGDIGTRNDPLSSRALELYARKVDRAAPIVSRLFKQFGDGVITKAERQARENAVYAHIARGGDYGTTIVSNSSGLADIGQVITDTGIKPADFREATRLVGQAEELRRFNNPKLTSSLDDDIASQYKINVDAMTDAQKKILAGVNKINADITEFLIDGGISNRQLVGELRDAIGEDDYIALARKFTDDELEVRRITSGISSTLNSKAGKLKGIKGSTRELVDPFVSTVSKANFASEIVALNGRNGVIRKMIDEGALAGRLVVDPSDVARKSEIISDLSNLRLVKKQTDAIATSLGRDLAKSARKSSKLASTIDAKVNSVVEELVGRLLNDETLRPTMQRVVDISEDVPTDIQEFAIEILASQGDDIYRRLGDEAIARDQFNELFTKALNAQEDSKLLNETIRDLWLKQSKLKTSFSGSQTLSFYEDGFKGKMIIDDPDVYTALTSTRPADSGHIQRFLRFTTRVFKGGTTGNPVFGATVNPIRDAIQSLVVQGPELFDPRVQAKTLAEITGLPSELVDRASRQGLGQSTRNDLTRNTKDVSKQSEDVLTQARGDKIRFQRWTGTERYFGQSSDTFLRAWESFSDVPERTMRNVILKSKTAEAIAAGADPEDALQMGIYAANNTTANFKTIGYDVGNILMNVPYARAKYGANISFAKNLIDDPVGIVLRSSMLITFPALRLTAYNLGNPELASTYTDIPDYRKDAGLNIVLGPGDVIHIPLPQEVMNFIRPTQILVEQMYGLDRESFTTAVGKSLLNFAPLPFNPGDLLATNNPGEPGISSRILQAAGSITPQAIKPFVESALNTDLFTGQQINPDEEVISDGLTDLTGGDFTLPSRDSKTLRFLADKIPGVKQGDLQNFLKKIGSSTGEQALSVFDRLIGAPESQQGGRGIVDSISRRFIGLPFEQSQISFNDLLDEADGRKRVVESVLSTYDSQIRSARFDGNTEAINQLQSDKQVVLDKYVSELSDALDEYSQFYSQMGGLDGFQKSRVTNLLSFADETIFSGDASSAAFDEAGNINSAEKRLARERARSIGINIDIVDSIFLEEPYRNASVLRDEVSNYYASRDDAVIDLKGLLDSTGLKDLRQAFNDEYWDAVRARQFTKSNKLLDDFNNSVRDLTQGFIDRHGSQIIQSNPEVRELLADYVRVPYELQRSAGRSPYVTQDAEEYVRFLFGVNEDNPSNLIPEENLALASQLPIGATTSQEVLSLVDRIESAQSEGSLGTLESIQSQLNSLLESGQATVSTNDATRIQSALR